MTRISYEKASYFYEYNPKTGAIHRKVNSGKSKKGDLCSSKDTHGYIIACVCGKKIQAHRLAWILHYKRTPGFIDHINKNRADNRIINLREVTRSGNQKNQKISSRNTSGAVGVCWDKAYAMWRGRINSERKAIFIGLFDDFFEAICRRKSAEIKERFYHNHGGVI